MPVYTAELLYIAVLFYQNCMTIARIAPDRKPTQQRPEISCDHKAEIYLWKEYELTEAPPSHMPV